MRQILAALLLTLGLASPALAAVCTPTPALPDTERRTEYAGIVAQTGPFNVGFQLYGDSTDYGNWVSVWINGVALTPVTDFTVTSPSGALANLCRPITDAQVTFTAAQTGTIEIEGSRRPRRTSQVSENAGVTARTFNQVVSDMTAQLRERWDRQSRLLRSPPGETLSVLPTATSRASGVLGFDTAGNPIILTPTTATLPAGVPQNILRTIIANGSINTNDCGKTLQLGTGTTGLFSLTVPSPAGFPSTCVVTFTNADTGRGKNIVGFSGCTTPNNAILWPLQTCTIALVNGAWTATSRPGRWKHPGGTLNIFSDFVNGSNANDCLAAGAGNACKTAEAGLSLLCDNLDFSGSFANQTLARINLAAATTDTTGAHYSCPSIPGVQGGAAIMIQGQATTSTISTTGADALGFFIGGTIQIRNITLQTTTAGACITAGLKAQVYILDQVTFNSCADAHISASDAGSNIYLQNNYAVFGSAPFHFLEQNGALISTKSTVVATLGANITVNTWALAGQGGGIIVPNWSVNLNSFTVTGQRSQANNLGLIFTGGTATACRNSYFPGTVNGTTSNGGACDGGSINLATDASGILPSTSFPALTGDVTTPSGSVATTIANAAVSNAKMANMNAATIKGNNTGGAAAPSDLTVAQLSALLTRPTTQTFLSGSGTYTTPANVTWIEVWVVGGGGGGAGSGTTPGAPGAGVVSTFGSSLLTANGGAAGRSDGGVAAGGSATGGDDNLTGGSGGPAVGATNAPGGQGGSNPRGGAGNSAASAAGVAAIANTGGGGGGAGESATNLSGGGGAAGGWLRKIIGGPSATYPYAVGGGGAAGTAGTGGSAGGAGGSGFIQVIEHYN